MANSKRLCKYHKTRTRDYIVVNNMAFCTFDYAVKWASENKSIGKEKIKNEIKKRFNKKKKKFKDNDKSIRTREAQKSFNAFIRYRDKDMHCISCDKPSDWNGQWHCGHFKTVGARSDLRFEEANAAKQCSQCNNFLSGNIIEYKKELIKRIGVNVVSGLDIVLTKKYTCADLKEIEMYFKSKLKVLKLNYNQI